MERRPSDVLVVRGADPEPLGFLMILPLAELREEEKERDPALRAASAYLHGPVALRPGELGTYFRF